MGLLAEWIHNWVKAFGPIVMAFLLGMSAAGR